MSPTVTAPRRGATARARSGASRASSHRAASRPPRRVSGPVGGRAGLAHAPREMPALGGRALALIRGLPDHSLIDRLVRGRAWIPVLGVLLAGIVAMQVEILKLGASMGRAMEQSTTLQTRNESLQANVATLADDQRIERLAAATGMAMPLAGSMVFLSSHPNGDIAHALANIHVPDPTGFTSQLAAQAAAVAALMPSSPTTTTSATSATQAGTASTATGTSTQSSVSSSGTVTTASSSALTQATPATTTPATSMATTTAPATTTAATTTPSATNSSGAATVAPTTSQSGGG